jgi:hypothetical protein
MPTTGASSGPYVSQARRAWAVGNLSQRHIDRPLGRGAHHPRLPLVSFFPLRGEPSLRRSLVDLRGAPKSTLCRGGPTGVAGPLSRQFDLFSAACSRVSGVSPISYIVSGFAGHPPAFRREPAAGGQSGHGQARVGAREQALEPQGLTATHSIAYFGWPCHASPLRGATSVPHPRFRQVLPRSHHTKPHCGPMPNPSQETNHPTTDP